ncbi:BQ2448_4566 [Microbotryum intermedium]|uniref:BQ2448_4566 protein n=1 Tax=Microbotryum intermedium TaxID=269621 RepID=A0A238FDH1_9BASI|nr:BQ2448_4566 [Microbotryum intermedium]
MLRQPISDMAGKGKDPVPSFPTLAGFAYRILAATARARLKGIPFPPNDVCKLDPLHDGFTYATVDLTGVRFVPRHGDDVAKPSSFVLQRPDGEACYVSVLGQVRQRGFAPDQVDE